MKAGFSRWLSCGGCLAVGAVLGLGLRALLLGLSQPEPFQADVELVFASDTPLPIELVEGQPEERERAALYQDAVRLALKDVPAALDLLGADTDRRADWIRARLMTPRPDLAAEAAHRSHLHEITVEATQRWQRLDAAAAAGWLHNHWEPALAQVLADQALEDDPGFAVRAMMQQPGTEELVADVISRWAELDSLGVMKLLEMTPSLRVDQLGPEVGQSLAMLPGERLRPWLDQLDRPAQEELVQSWVAMMPSTSSMARSQRFLASAQGLARSPEATRAWYQLLAAHGTPQLENITHPDAAVLGIAQGLSPLNPAQALPWLGQLSNEQQRTASLTSGVQAWLKVDRAQAMAWLSSSGAIALLSSPACDALRQRYLLAGTP